MESFTTGTDLILKASETEGEYGFTTVTVSVPMLSVSWACMAQRLKKKKKKYSVAVRMIVWLITVWIDWWIDFCLTGFY